MSVLRVRLVNHKTIKSRKNLCISICFVLLSGVLNINLQNTPPFPRPTPTLKCLCLRVCAGKGVRASGLHRCSSVLFPECGDHRACTPLTERKREIKLFARIKRSKLRLVGEMFGAGVVLCMFLSALQQSYHLCIPRKEIARPCWGRAPTTTCGGLFNHSLQEETGADQ